MQAEVNETVGPHVFLGGEDDTLVVGAAIPPNLSEDAQVQVTGTVREFVLAEVEPEPGFEFDENERSFVVEYEDELVIDARDVQVLPGC